MKTKVEKGSQKRAKHPTATDDPDKYIGKWEKYDTPQGISSRKKKSTTNITEGLERFREQGITINPNHEDIDRVAEIVLSSSERNRHIKGLYDPRGRFIIWDGVSDTVGHQMVLEELMKIYGKVPFKMWYSVVKSEAEGIRKDMLREYYNEAYGYIPLIIDVQPDGSIGQIWAMSDSVLKTDLVRNALYVHESINRILESVYSDKSKFNTVWDPSFMPDPEDAPSIAPYYSPPKGVDGIEFIIDFGVKGTMRDKAHRKDNRKKIKPKKVKKANTSIKLVKEKASDIQGGPGQSNDLVARDRNVLTLADLEDTSPNDTDMENNKAPKKQTRIKTKKLNTDTSGLINEKISRSPVPQLNADYEMRDDADTETIGIAKVANGVIETLAVRNDFKEDFNGHILSKLMSTIINDADLTNANLSIRLQDEQDLQHKRFLERFGFRHTQNGIMKRTAGAIRPPSVPSSKI